MTHAVAALTNRQGHTLRYQYFSGKGPTVVFLGGFKSEMMGTKGNWLAQWSEETGRSFLRLDYSGHGLSGGRFVDGTIGSWSADAIEVINATTSGPLLLVGSSMGGWIMLLVALSMPSRIQAMVGIAAAPDFTRNLIWPSLTVEQQQTLLTQGRVNLPSEYDDSEFPITKALIEDGDQHLLLGDSISLTCPVRLLHGQQDADVPWEVSLTLADQLVAQDVQVTLFKSGDHRLSEPEYLGKLVQTIEEML